MANNFDLSLRYVLLDEGGNSDDPQDHGGRTSRGITQQEYDVSYSGDVWQASDEQIDSIYKTQYWEPYCDKLPTGLDYLFFDISVNAGRSQAVKSFQKALEVTVDGVMGIITLDAISKANPVDLIHKVSEVRRNFYRNLAQFPRYGKGWLNRVNASEGRAVAMAGEPNTVAPDSPKANEKDVTKTSVAPETSGGVTVASGGLMSMLDSFKESLSAYGDMSYIKYTLIAVAVASLGYSLYGFYLRGKAQEAVS